MPPFLYFTKRWHPLFSAGLTGPVCPSSGPVACAVLLWRHLSPRANAPEVRDLNQANAQLQRELKRKDKALAEAAALLVLSKKYQALFGDEDE